MHRQSLLMVFGLVFSTSCVPQPTRLSSAHVSQTIVDARPLLQKLDLHVPIDDAGPLTATAAAFARNGFDGAPPFVAAAHSADDERRATDCLTDAVYYEARSEPVDGQRAVAQVVLNRVRDRAFPHSVCGVVFQGSERRTGCQFSFTCDGSMNRMLDPGAWDRARDVAQAALAGSVYTPVGSATHYHADYVLPWWASSLTRIGAVGSHIFYRWRGALEKALAFRQDYSGSEPGILPGMAVTATAAIAGVTVHYAGGIGTERSPDAATLSAAVPASNIAAAPQGSVMIHRGPTTASIVASRMTKAVGVHIHVGNAPGGVGLDSDGADPHADVAAPTDTTG